MQKCVGVEGNVRETKTVDYFGLGGLGSSSSSAGESEQEECEDGEIEERFADEERLAASAVQPDSQNCDPAVAKIPTNTAKNKLLERTPLSEHCAVCMTEPPKYKCPACLTQSCSLDCSKAHKINRGCSGERDRTVFVPRAELDINQLMSGEWKRKNECSVAHRLASNTGNQTTRFCKTLPGLSTTKRLKRALDACVEEVADRRGSDEDIGKRTDPHAWSNSS